VFCFSPGQYPISRENKKEMNTSTYVAPSQPLRNKTNVLNVSRNSNNITKAKAHVPSKAAQRRAEKRLAEQQLLNHLKDLVSYQVTLRVHFPRNNYEFITLQFQHNLVFEKSKHVSLKCS